MAKMPKDLELRAVLKVDCVCIEVIGFLKSKIYGGIYSVLENL